MIYSCINGVKEEHFCLGLAVHFDPNTSYVHVKCSFLFSILCTKEVKVVGDASTSISFRILKVDILVHSVYNGCNPSLFNMTLRSNKINKITT